MSPATARLVARLLAATLVLLGARHARADEPEARLRAQELLDEGNLLFREGDPRGALARYREAYGTFASAKLFFNIGLCEEGVGERAQAMNSYGRFLVEAQDASPAVRAEAEQHVHALEPLLTLVELTGAANGVVTIDGALAGVMPLKVPLWTEPGIHRVSVELPGSPAWVTNIVGRPGARMSLAVPEPTAAVSRNIGLPEMVTDNAPALPGGLQSQAPRSRRWWLWTTLGVVLVGGSVATFLVLRNRCPATNGCE